MSRTGNASHTGRRKPVVFHHHTSDSRGAGVTIQRKRNPTGKNRFQPPTTPSGSSALPPAVDLRERPEVDDFLRDFDDQAGEESYATLDGIEPQKANKSTPNRQLQTWLTQHLESVILALHAADAAPAAGQSCPFCNSGSQPRFCCQTCLEPVAVCKACLLSRHRYLPLHRVRAWSGICWEDTSLMELGFIWSLGHGGQSCEESKSVSTLWVGDVFGYVQVKIRYCGHAGAPSKPIQLLRAGLFPCSDIEPQSAFSLSMLGHFTLFSTVGKISGHRYDSVLTRQTNTGFPASAPNRYRELLFTQRKFAYATAMKRSGRLFKALPGAVFPQSLAINCVACPRAGVNFRPEDVSAEERPYFRYFVSHDGNFRNRRKAKRIDPDDICLTDGQMYFVKQEPYKKWVAQKKGSHSDRPRPDCDNHKAAQDKFARWGGLDVTGVGACTCARHSLFLPAGMVDFDKGESWANVDYAIASACSTLVAWGVILLAITYDIFCHWFPGFESRLKELPHELYFNIVLTELIGGIPRFHAAGHNEACRVRYSLNYMLYIGRIEGEGCERAWAYLNETAESTSEKSPGARWDAINFIVGDWNFEKIITIVLFILGKFKEAKRMHEQQSGVFKDLDSSLPPAITAEWRKESTAPRKVGKTWTSVYFGSRDWGKSIEDTLRQEQLVDEPEDLGSSQTGSSLPTPKKNELERWLAKAIELENALDKLRVDAAQLKPNSTIRQHNSINDRRKLMIARVAAHRLERERFMGVLADPDHPESERVASSDVEYAELGLPSAYRSSTLIDGNCIPAAQAEALLRRLTCDDSLKTVRHLLGAKSLALRYKRKNLTGKRATTRAEKLLKDLREQVDKAKRRYSRSRDALLRLDLLGSDIRTYQELKAEHLKMLSDYLENESGAVGQGSCEIAWIWRTEAASNSEDWMIDALKVEWFRARQRAKQWEEELILLKREVVMALKSFQHEQREWDERSKQAGLPPGMAEYASRKSKFFEKLASDAHYHGNSIVSVIFTVGPDSLIAMGNFAVARLCGIIRLTKSLNLWDI
ncbi:hypothetical protein RhiJN_26261 [Ceratobasidium sp. AG-Ba]|nr:hypothetical protein RhiJN_26261 [Ceratobasidium sp. AG-Ba]